MRQVHAIARTTPLIRAEIKASELDVVEPAKRFNVSRLTVAKWKLRDKPQGRSHWPYKLSTMLSEG